MFWAQVRGCVKKKRLRTTDLEYRGEGATLQQHLQTQRPFKSLRHLTTDLTKSLGLLEIDKMIRKSV